MGIDIFSGGNSSIDRLIEIILQLESRPRFLLESRQDTLKTRKTVLSDIDSKLSALSTLSKRLTDSITDYFAIKSVSSSDETIITATADATALASSHDVIVSRLASSDTRVSMQYTETDTDLKTFFDTNGSQTFQIQVGHPTTDDSSNRVDISVTINPTGTDNDSILTEIAVAINSAMSSAVAAETIDADEKVSASVVHEEDGTSRLIFRSTQSGFTNRQSFTDSTNSLLSTLEISNSVLSSGTAGGYITAIGTTASDSELNSQLLVDGLTFYRDSNTINDIMDGVTMNIKDVNATSETLQVSEDTEAVKKEVDDFISAYNDIIRFLREKSKVDPETSTRGVLSGESTYTFLRTNLRSIFTSTITGVSSGNPQNLFEIGITSASDGTLSISDAEEFESVLSTGAGKISDLFNNSTDGVATQIKAFLNDWIKVGGVLDHSQDTVADRIKNLDRQMGRFDERLGRREAQLRLQFARMQQISLLLGRQQAAFSSLVNSIRF